MLHNLASITSPYSFTVGVPNDQLVIENLVFSGGGIKGLAYGGVIQELEKKGKISNVKRYAGASAGAITAALLAIGMTGDDIINELSSVDFAKFLKPSFIDIPELVKDPKEALKGHPIKDVLALAEEFFALGLCTGTEFYAWIVKKIISKKHKPGVTFKDLYNATHKELHIVMCNTNYEKTLIANYANTPNMKIADAVRGSMAIPFIYTPLEWNGDKYVDGGTMYNYPVDLFDEVCDPETTLGFILSSSQSILTPKHLDNVKNVFGQLGRVFNALMNVSYEYCFRLGNQYRTIFVDPGNVGTLDFDLSPEQKTMLINNGISAVDNFFSNVFGPDKNNSLDRRYAFNVNVPVGKSVTLDFEFHSDWENAIIVYDSIYDGKVNQETISGNLNRNNTKWTSPVNTTTNVQMYVVTAWHKESKENPANPWLQSNGIKKSANIIGFSVNEGTDNYTSASTKVTILNTVSTQSHII